MTAPVRHGRVTLVVNSSDGVSETFLRALADLLIGLGHEVTVHSLRPVRSGRTAPSTDRAWSASAALPRPRHPLALVVALVRLTAASPATVAGVAAAAVRRFGPSARAAKAALDALPIVATKPDVVHFAFTGIAVSLADARRLLGDAATVVSCRGTGEQVRPVLDADRARALGRMFGEVEAIHAVSEALAATITGLGAPAERITVIRPAIDAGAFTRTSPRAEPSAPTRLVTVARLHWIKGIEDLLDAVARLRSESVDVRLDVVGDGPDAESLRFRSWALGLGDIVTFTGALSPTDVRASLERADAFVLSSLSEGVSNAALEAMALGLPVISTDVGGMGEVITDGVDGLLVPPGDPAAIATAVARLAADPALAARLARAGLDRVLDEFTLDRQRREIELMYQRLLGGGAPDDADFPRADAPSTTENT